MTSNTPEWADLVSEWVHPKEWHRWQPGEYWSEPAGPGRLERPIWRVSHHSRVIEYRYMVAANDERCNLSAPTSRDNLPDAFRRLSAALAAFREAK